MTTFYNPTEVEIGIHSLNQLPQLIRKYGKHPLLVHGHRPVEDGLLEKVRTVLNQAGIPHENMGQILPNPKYDSIKRGAKIAIEKDCDLIISLGGGSTLQCAKGIAYAISYTKDKDKEKEKDKNRDKDKDKGKDKDKSKDKNKSGDKDKDNDKAHLWDLWTGKDKPKGMIPVASILTNPASGDELNSSCTIVKDGEQKTLNSPYGYCSFAVLDPSLSMLPSYPTMCQCFEIFAFLFMRYLNASETEAKMDLVLMQDVLESSRQLESNQNDLEARNALFFTGFMAHMLHQENKFNLNKLSNELAFRHSLSEGEALASLFSSWYKQLGEEYQPRLACMAKMLFGIQSTDAASASEEGLIQIQKTISNMGLADTIEKTGLIISDEDLKKLTNNADDLKILQNANSRKNAE